MIMILIIMITTSIVNEKIINKNDNIDNNKTQSRNF